VKDPDSQMLAVAVAAALSEHHEGMTV
jgi:hypothetical protein